MPELRGGALITVILVVSGLDFLLFGYDQGLFGGILAGPRFTEMLGHPTPTLTGLVTAIYDVSSIFYTMKRLSMDVRLTLASDWLRLGCCRCLPFRRTDRSKEEYHDR